MEISSYFNFSNIWWGAKPIGEGGLTPQAPMVATALWKIKKCTQMHTKRNTKRFPILLFLLRILNVFLNFIVFNTSKNFQQKFAYYTHRRSVHRSLGGAWHPQFFFHATPMIILINFLSFMSINLLLNDYCDLIMTSVIRICIFT